MPLDNNATENDDDKAVLRWNRSRLPACLSHDPHRFPTATTACTKAVVDPTPPAGHVRPSLHAEISDLQPTMLVAAHVKQPAMMSGVKQRPIEGTSMVYTFDNARARSTRRAQYFELLFGNRAIYQEGWIAATTPVAPPWATSVPSADVIKGYKWELYNVANDISEARRLADSNPAKLKALRKVFYRRAPSLKSSENVVAGDTLSGAPPTAMPRKEFDLCH